MSGRLETVRGSYSLEAIRAEFCEGRFFVFKVDLFRIGPVKEVDVHEQRNGRPTPVFEALRLAAENEFLHKIHKA